MPGFVDTHAHLYEPEFAADADSAVERALAAGVEALIVPGVDVETTAAALDLAERHACVFAAAGFHPHEASRFGADALRRVEELSARPKAVAVGEIGLDYYRMHSSREEQLVAIEAQLELAGRLVMPVVVHCRDAWEDMRQVLTSWSLSVKESYTGRPLGVMHYFTGSLEDARLYTELGFLISAHTSITHPKQQALREVFTALPLEGIVIETDSPYSAPQALRGKRNEPAYVAEAAKQLAELKGVSLDVVADATSANARRLFRLSEPAVSNGVAGAAV